MRFIWFIVGCIVMAVCLKLEDSPWRVLGTVMFSMALVMATLGDLRSRKDNGRD